MVLPVKRKWNGEAVVPGLRVRVKALLSFDMRGLYVKPKMNWGEVSSSSVSSCTDFAAMWVLVITCVLDNWTWM